MSEEEAIQRLSRSPHWVWTAIDPQSKLLLAIASARVRRPWPSALSIRSCRSSRPVVSRCS